MAKFTIDLSQPLGTYSPYSKSLAAGYTKARSIYVPSNQLNGSTIHHHGDIIEADSYNAVYLQNIKTQITDIVSYVEPVEPEPPFSPLDFDGLQAWQKADGTLWQDSSRTIPAIAENDPIGSWDDESGNDNHILQTTSASRPQLRLVAQNGLPMLDFDGDNDWLGIDSLATTLSGTNRDFTCFLVFSNYALSSTGYWGYRDLLSITGSEGFVQIYLSETAPNAIAFDFNTDDNVYTYITDPTNTSTLTTPHSIIAVCSSTNLTIYLDGITFSTNLPSPHTLTGTDYNIGAWNPSPGYFFEGSIGEHGVYDSALDSEQVTQLYNYLKTKWDTP